jgi:hypothetical protein
MRDYGRHCPLSFRIVAVVALGAIRHVSEFFHALIDLLASNSGRITIGGCRCSLRCRTTHGDVAGESRGFSCALCVIKIQVNFCPTTILRSYNRTAHRSKSVVLIDRSSARPVGVFVSLTLRRAPWRCQSDSKFRLIIAAFGQLLLPAKVVAEYPSPTLGAPGW